jgi:hypothetical protein
VVDVVGEADRTGNPTFGRHGNGPGGADWPQNSETNPIRPEA